jgi:hypothetical protein
VGEALKGSGVDDFRQQGLKIAAGIVSAPLAERFVHVGGHSAFLP